MEKYEIGQIVYLITDPDQRDRIVTGILKRRDGVTFELSCGVETSWNYDFEISDVRNIIKATSN